MPAAQRHPSAPTFALPLNCCPQINVQLFVIGFYDWIFNVSDLWSLVFGLKFRIPHSAIRQSDPGFEHSVGPSLDGPLFQDHGPIDADPKCFSSFAARPGIRATSVPAHRKVARTGAREASGISARSAPLRGHTIHHVLGAL